MLNSRAHAHAADYCSDNSRDSNQLSTATLTASGAPQQANHTSQLGWGVRMYVRVRMFVRPSHRNERSTTRSMRDQCEIDARSMSEALLPLLLLLRTHLSHSRTPIALNRCKIHIALGVITAQEQEILHGAGRNGEGWGGVLDGCSATTRDGCG